MKKSYDIQIKDRNEMKKYFSKFKFLNLKELFEKMVKKRPPTTKSGIISEFINFSFEDGMTCSQLEVFDLFYIRSQPENRRWQAYEIINSKKVKLDDMLDPSEILDRLTKNLSYFFEHYTSLTTHNHGFLFRIAIDKYVVNLIGDRSIKLNWSSIFVVYYYRSNYLYIAGSQSEKNIKFILLSLTIALKCKEITKINLEGPDLESLKDLLLYKNSQGPYRKFREEVIEEKKKDFEVKKRNIIKEQDLYRKRKKDEMEIVFGDIEYDQPKLDIVEYSLKANFQYKDAVLYECPINIIFKGKSILNGLAQCIKYGIVKPPLPSFVRDLPQSGKNIFSIDTGENVL